MGLALARLVCDEAGIRAGAGGTTVILRMSVQARRARAAVTGQGARGIARAVCCCAAARLAGQPGRQAAGSRRERDFCRKGGVTSGMEVMR